MRNNIFSRLLRLLIDDPEDLLGWPALRFVCVPSSERGGHRIEESDPAFGVGRQYGIANAAEGHAQQLLVLAQSLFALSERQRGCI